MRKYPLKKKNHEMQEIGHPIQESNIENPHNGSHEKNLESNQSGLQKGKEKN